MRSGRCCLRGCQSLPRLQRSPADERERTRTGTAPAGPEVGTQAPARTSRPTQPGTGCRSGRGRQWCVECSARREQDSHAETTSGTMQVVGLGCARRGHDGLHPLDAALNLLPERSLVDMRRRVTIATASRAPTAYALEATVVLDIIHVAAAMRRAVLVAQLIEGLSAFGPRPDGSRPAHGDTWLQLRRSSSRHGPPAH